MLHPFVFFRVLTGSGGDVGNSSFPTEDMDPEFFKAACFGCIIYLAKPTCWYATRLTPRIHGLGNASTTDVSCSAVHVDQYFMKLSP